MNDIGESGVGYIKRAALELIKAACEEVLNLVTSLVAIVTCVLLLPTLPLAAVYFIYLKGHSNCLLWAVVQRVKYAFRVRSWGAARVIAVRNSRGRLHFQVRVTPTGNVYEWYAKGASQRSRLANLWYKGEIKKVSK